MTKVFNNVLNDLQKEITKQIENEIKSHCKHLKSENQMLKHQVSELRRSNISNQNNHGKLEQYGRHLCFKSTAYPEKSVSQNDVLDPVNALFKEAKVDILESVIDQV